MNYMEKMKKLIATGGTTGAMAEKLKTIMEQKRLSEEERRKLQFERELLKAVIDRSFDRTQKLINGFLDERSK